MEVKRKQLFGLLSITGAIVVGFLSLLITFLVPDGGYTNFTDLDYVMVKLSIFGIFVVGAGIAVTYSSLRQMGVI